MQTAKRLEDIGEYYFSQKLREIDELNKAGKNVINLGIGSPDLPPHPEVIKTLHEEALKPNQHAYQSYKGSPILRKAIAAWYKKWYDVTLNPDTEILPLIGGLEFKLPIGKIYSKNITPDDETGIGKLPDSVIARSLRYGVARDGRALFDFMPFHNLSDEDLTAVISFLRSQPPTRNSVPDNQMNFVGKAVRAFLIKPVGPEGEIPKSLKPDTTAEYGKYLAHYIANCKGCHTNRSLMTGAYIGPEFAGGLKFEVADGGYTVTPNLTPDKETGRITGWSQEIFINRFRQKKIIAVSDMPWDQFRNMNNDDLKAIYKYLVSLKPIKNVTGPTYISAMEAKKAKK